MERHDVCVEGYTKEEEHDVRHKGAMIADTDAVVDPGTMMVVPRHTSRAYPAVLASQRFP